MHGPLDGLDDLPCKQDRAVIVCDRNRFIPDMHNTTAEAKRNHMGFIPHQNDDGLRFILVVILVELHQQWRSKACEKPLDHDHDAPDCMN